MAAFRKSLTVNDEVRPLTQQTEPGMLECFAVESNTVHYLGTIKTKLSVKPSLSNNGGSKYRDMLHEDQLKKEERKVVLLNNQIEPQSASKTRPTRSLLKGSLNVSTRPKQQGPTDVTRGPVRITRKAPVVTETTNESGKESLKLKGLRNKLVHIMATGPTKLDEILAKLKPFGLNKDVVMLELNEVSHSSCLLTTAFINSKLKVAKPQISSPDVYQLHAESYKHYNPTSWKGYNDEQLRKANHNAVIAFNELGLSKDSPVFSRISLDLPKRLTKKKIAYIASARENSSAPVTPSHRVDSPLLADSPVHQVFSPSVDLAAKTDTSKVRKKAGSPATFTKARYSSASKRGRSPLPNLANIPNHSSPADSVTVDTLTAQQSNTAMPKRLTAKSPLTTSEAPTIAVKTETVSVPIRDDKPIANQYTNWSLSRLTNECRHQSEKQKKLHQTIQRCQKIAVQVEALLKKLSEKDALIRYEKILQDEFKKPTPYKDFMAEFESHVNQYVTCQDQLLLIKEALAEKLQK